MPGCRSARKPADSPPVSLTPDRQTPAVNFLVKPTAPVIVSAVVQCWICDPMSLLILSVRQKYEDSTPLHSALRDTGFTPSRSIIFRWAVCFRSVSRGRRICGDVRCSNRRDCRSPLGISSMGFPFASAFPSGWSICSSSVTHWALCDHHDLLWILARSPI